MYMMNLVVNCFNQIVKSQYFGMKFDNVTMYLCCNYQFTNRFYGDSATASFETR